MTKEDPYPEDSDPHSHLQNAPITEQTIRARKRTGKDAAGSSSSKRQRKRRRDWALTVFDVSQVIQQRKISKRGELVCLAVRQKREGNTALAEAINGENAVNDALAVAKEFEEADKNFYGFKKPGLTY